MPDNWHIVDVIYMHLHVAAFYSDITSVLSCRLINVDILLLFLTIFLRYKAEIDTLLMQYTHAPFEFIYR